MEQVLAKEDTLYRLGVLEECPCHNIVLAGVNFPLYESTPKKRGSSKPRSIKSKTVPLSDEKVAEIHKQMDMMAVRWTNKEKGRGQVVKYQTEDEIALREQRRKDDKKRYGTNKVTPQAGDEPIEKYLIFEKAITQTVQDQSATIASQDQRIAELEATKASLEKQVEDAQAEEDNPRDRGPGSGKKKGKKGKHHADTVHGGESSDPTEMSFLGKDEK